MPQMKLHAMGITFVLCCARDAWHFRSEARHRATDAAAQDVLHVTNFGKFYATSVGHPHLHVEGIKNYGAEWSLQPESAFTGPIRLTIGCADSVGGLMMSAM